MHDFKSLNPKNMKKLFLSLMLVAALAAGFTSCTKDNNESTTHTQTFTLGETSYSIDNAISILNIQYQGSQVYSTLILSQGQMIGETGGEGKGVVIIFEGDIAAGTYRLSDNEATYPKYFLAEVAVDDVVNFDVEDFGDDEDAYMAFRGSLIIEKDENGKYVITTDGVEVINYEASILSSSVDYEGTPKQFVMATVLEGSLNDGNETAEIVTAGRMTTTLPLLGMQNLTSFISLNGNMLSFVYSGNTIPTGTQERPYLMLLNEMNIESPDIAQTGTLNIELVNEEGEDYYIVDITDATFNGVTYTMHYKGTLPFFDFPF